MDSGDEALDLLTFGKELVEQPTLKPAGITYIDFDGFLHPSLQLHEDLSEGCGGQLWPAGMVLSKYMLRFHKETVKGKTMFVRVELGAGGGLVGLVVALAFPSSFQKPLLITDQLPMLALMQHNIKLNNLTSTVEAVIYDWGHAPPPNITIYPDIILAADCVYFEPAFPLLQKTLQDLIGENTVCYFCFKKRRRADMHFVKVMKKMFEVKVVEDDPDRETYSRENLFLYELRKRKS